MSRKRAIPEAETAASRAAARTFSIICLSPQDWWVALPTNRQQIMRRAAARGHDVLFVETGGWVGRQAWRLLRDGGRRSLLRRLTTGEPVAPRVEVRKLLTVFPWSQKFAYMNRLNWRIGSRGIRRAARRLPAPRIVWIYDPRAVEAVGTLGESFAVYDCVDDYAEQARYSERSRALVAEADAQAAARSRLVFATTRRLERRQLERNPRTHLVPNVGDFAHFSPAVDPAYAEVDLRELPRPVLGFAGSLDAEKVDFDALALLADAFPEGTILVAGPARGPAHSAIRQLSRRPNLLWVGPREYAELPRVVAAFDVALIPYLSNEYTQSCFPLKLYEYLAAGKPVVATGLPELGGLEPTVTLVGREGLIAAVRDALAEGVDGRDARISLAARNTWDVRTSTLLELIDAELAG